MSNAPAAAPAATFGDDDFGGGGFGEAPAAAPAASGFEGFGGETAPAANLGGFGGDVGFGGDDVFGAAPAESASVPAAVPASTPFDLSGGNELLGSAPGPVPTPAPQTKKPSMFSNAPVVDNCETTALECVHYHFRFRKLATSTFLTLITLNS